MAENNVDSTTAVSSTSSSSASSIPSESRAAARGTLITLVLRLVSFACTQATFRFLDPSTLGKANIQLELLLTTVLFISREGFRLSLTRNVSPENWNVAWLTIPVVTLVAGGTLIWHYWSFSTSTSDIDGIDKDYLMAGTLYCIASWIEGCAEPAVLYFLRNMDVPKRASAEGLATLTKTIATVVGIHLLDKSWHVTAFGAAQLIYALTYSIYLFTMSRSKLAWPTKSYDMETCRLTLLFTLQGFFKHLLTEADRIVLAAVSDSYNQGVYAMGSAYGGMAARMLLQPLEENARLLWSRLASRNNTNELKQSYTVLVKLVLYIGLLFSCIAVNYTNLLLVILAGRKWGSNGEAANVLSAFCVYTAMLACNGMTEAFVYGVAGSGAEVGRLGIAHAMTGIVFALSAFFLVARFGTLGLVGANCVAMSIRSMYSIHFAARYFGERDSKSVGVARLDLLFQMIPHPIVVGCFGVAFMITNWTLARLRSEGFHQVLNLHDKNWLLLTGQHLGAGVSCVIGVASVALALETGFVGSLHSMVRPKQD